MKPILIAEIMNIAEYEKIRSEYRSRIIELKNHRRISVGPKVTFVFENRETILSQIQEMMRAERIVHDDKIQHEIDVYNQLMPGKNELSATMFIEITEGSHIKAELEKLFGITRTECVFITIGNDIKVPAIFEEGHEEENKLSAVQYVRFRFSDDEREKFLSGSTSTGISICHSNYNYEAGFPKDIHDSLAEDMRSE